MKYMTVLLLCLVPMSHCFFSHVPALQPSPRPISSDVTSASCLSLKTRTTHVVGRRRKVITSMGWGDDVVWTKTTIAETSKIAEGQHFLTIKSGELASEYKVPGQYVQIKVGADGKPGFFAISNAPSSVDENGTLEFLVKAVEATEPLVNAQAGATVEMSQIMGKGFPIEDNFKGYKYDFPVQNVILTATGTGIAPIRAAIEEKALELPDEDDDGVFGRSCKLYWGCRNEETLPWGDKMTEWDEMGVEVVPVLSQPSSSWKGRKGYVQDALKEDGVRVPRNTAVLMCGQKEMAQDVLEVCSKAGVLEGRVLTNF